jgi:predicted Rdx family selenoprotein
MAGEALSRAGEHISSFKLTPGPHGKFDVIVDGSVVAEHRHEPDAHIFPDLQDLMKAINDRTG